MLFIPPRNTGGSWWSFPWWLLIEGTSKKGLVGAVTIFCCSVIAGFIILPQALKSVFPGIVTIFIALFDLLAVVQSAFADVKWIGYSVEGSVFVTAIYWLSCFSMFRSSQYL